VKLRELTFSVIGLTAALATPAFAGPNLVTNGSFEFSSGTTQQAPCQVGFNCSGTGNSIAGWTMDTSSTYPQAGTPPQPDTASWFPGYTFVMDSTNSVNGNAGAVSLWVSPGPEDGLNFLAQDAYYHPDAILVGQPGYRPDLRSKLRVGDGPAEWIQRRHIRSMAGFARQRRADNDGTHQECKPFGHGVGG
jgi:hypothetical protein